MLHGSNHAPAASKGGTMNAPDTGRRLLVVEDDATNRMVLTRQLAVVGVAAEIASNGEEGLERWRSGRFAMVLSDLHMPVMDGFGLVRAIRAEERAPARTPVLAFSADVRVGQAERTRDAGFDAFLTKPLQLEGLRAVLARWMVPGPGAGAVAEPVPVQAAIFDVGVLRDTVGEEALMLEIVVHFDAMATGMRDELLRAASDTDAGGAAMLAHRLKSSSRSVGALRLGASCSTLEEQVEAGRGDMVEPMVADVVDALDAALAAMRCWSAAHSLATQYT